jgi:hypothetical protein
MCGFALRRAGVRLDRSALCSIAPSTAAAVFTRSSRKTLGASFLNQSFIRLTDATISAAH